MNPIFVVIGLSIVGVIGDYCIKLSGRGVHPMTVRWFVAGMSVYAATAFGWWYAMRHIKLSSLGAIYAVTSVLFIIFVGVFIFHEKLRPQEMIGIVMAVISLILLAKFT